MMFHRVDRKEFYQAVAAASRAATFHGHTYQRTVERTGGQSVITYRINGIPNLQRIRADGVVKLYRLR